MRRAAKVDKNQKELIAYMRALGAYVIHTHQLKNAFDCIAVYRGQTFLVEIKDPIAANFPKFFFDLEHDQKIDYIVKNHLTDSKTSTKGGEKKCYEEVTARGGNYVVIWSKESILKLFKNKSNGKKEKN